MKEAEALAEALKKQEYDKHFEKAIAKKLKEAFIAGWHEAQNWIIFDHESEK